MLCRRHVAAKRRSSSFLSSSALMNHTRSCPLGSSSRVVKSNPTAMEMDLYVPKVVFALPPAPIVAPIEPRIKCLPYSASRGGISAGSRHQAVVSISELAGCSGGAAPLALGASARSTSSESACWIASAPKCSIRSLASAIAWHSLITSARSMPCHDVSASCRPLRHATFFASQSGARLIDLPIEARPAR